MADTVANMAFGVSRAVAARPVRERHDVRAGEADVREFPRVRILFENGGGSDPGAPAARFEADYPSWPVANTPTPWYFDAERLARRRRAGASAGADSYVYDPSHQHDTTIANADTARDVGEAAQVLVDPGPQPGPRWRTRPRRSATT